MARLLKKRGEASDIRIDDLPLKLDSEIQNFAMHGTVSTGKSTLMRKILKQLRDRGDFGHHLRQGLYVRGGFLR